MAADLPSLFRTTSQPRRLTTSPTPVILSYHSGIRLKFQSRSTVKSGHFFGRQETKTSSSYARISTRLPLSNASWMEESEAELEEYQTPQGYNPSIWGNYFHTYTPSHNQENNEKVLQVLKEELRLALISTIDKPLKHLKFIDAIERLGVAYHFKDEIEASLHMIYDDYNLSGDHEQDGLHYVSLRFRLLRQHGYCITSDSFKKFTNSNKDFPESLATDMLGILSLYEATHVRVHDDDILEKALSFTTHHLRTAILHPDNPLFIEVKHALSRPLHKSLVAVEGKHHIASYEHDQTHCEALLKFAKVNFNVLQSLYKRELQELSRWGEKLRYGEKFPFSRDRLVENYFFAVGMLREPIYSLGRIIITKTYLILTPLDDLHDSYGKIEDLKVLTAAIERWDKSCIELLPDYIKMYYKTLLDVFEEVENDLIDAGSPNHFPYVLEEVKKFSRVCMKAAKCRETNSKTTFEDYLKHALFAVGCNVSLAIALMAMGEEAYKEDFECVSLFPNVVRASSIITRLLNDIQGYKFDRNEGGFSSLILYMKQHGVTKEEACIELYRHIEATWIDINEEMCLHTRRRLRKLLVNHALSMARIACVLYDGEDGYRHVREKMKDNIVRMFVDPITL